MEDASVREYFAYINEKIEFYRSEGVRNLHLYTTTRIGVIVLAAAIPFAATIDDNQTWIGLLGFLVAAATGVDSLMRFGEKWQVFRPSEVALSNRLRQFNYDASFLSDDSRNLSVDAFRKLFEGFVEECDTIIRLESERFWTITEAGRKPQAKTSEPKAADKP